MKPAEDLWVFKMVEKTGSEIQSERVGELESLKPVKKKFELVKRARQGDKKTETERNKERKLMKHRRKWTPAFIALQNAHTLCSMCLYLRLCLFMCLRKSFKKKKETEIYYQRNSGCLLLQCDSLSLSLSGFCCFSIILLGFCFVCIVLFYICVRVLPHVKAKDRLTDFRKSESDMAFQL